MALAAALGIEPIARVREAIITALMRIGNAASVEVLLPYLRAQDAGQRAAAIDALQGLPHEIAPFLTALLRDSDSDVRILATELARNVSGRRKPPGCFATCSPLSRIPMFARRRLTCSRRSAPKMPFRCSSNAAAALPTRHFYRSPQRKRSR